MHHQCPHQGFQTVYQPINQHLGQLLQVSVIKHEVQCNARQGRTGNKQGYPAIFTGFSLLSTEKNSNAYRITTAFITGFPCQFPVLPCPALQCMKKSENINFASLSIISCVSFFLHKASKSFKNLLLSTLKQQTEICCECHKSKHNFLQIMMYFYIKLLGVLRTYLGHFDVLSTLKAAD